MRTMSFRAIIKTSAKSVGTKSLALGLCAAASIPALMIGAASNATAADLSYKDDRPAIMSYGGSWTGFYFGANAGWSGADKRAANPFIDFVPANSLPGGAGGAGGGTSGDGGDGGGAGGIGAFGDSNDAVIGLHLGYNWQTGSLVYGVEADIGANGSLNDLLGSLRGRVGYGTPRTLFYATAGLAYLSIDGDARSVLVGGDGGAGGDEI